MSGDEPGYREALDKAALSLAITLIRENPIRYATLYVLNLSYGFGGHGIGDGYGLRGAYFFVLQLAALLYLVLVAKDEPSLVQMRNVAIFLSLVRSEIAGQGGRIDVSSKQGLGTSFIIHLPLTLAVTQVLMVRSGDLTYAIPSTMVEQVRQVKSEDLAQLYRDRQIEWQGKIYSFHYLPHLLGDAERIPESLPRNPVLMLRSGEQRIALHVDDLQGNHEAVVKNIGPQLSRLPGIAGATVLGNAEHQYRSRFLFFAYHNPILQLHLPRQCND
jgi:hypothetical protein